MCLAPQHTSTNFAFSEGFQTSTSATLSITIMPPRLLLLADEASTWCWSWWITWSWEQSPQVYSDPSEVIAAECRNPVASFNTLPLLLTLIGCLVSKPPFFLRKTKTLPPVFSSCSSTKVTSLWHSVNVGGPAHCPWELLPTATTLPDVSRISMWSWPIATFSTSLIVSVAGDLDGELSSSVSINGSKYSTIDPQTSKW